MPTSKNSTPTQSKSYYWRNKEDQNAKNKARHFKKKYGITETQRDEMIAAQGFQCAICRSPDPGGRYDQWCVDHCHATGKVRAILCTRCNFMLGYAQDNVTTLYNAIDYLRAHNG